MSVEIGSYNPTTNDGLLVIKFFKVGIMSEDIGGFLPLPKNIPKNYLKLSYPVHNNDKVLVGFNRLYVKKYYSYRIEK